MPTLGLRLARTQTRTSVGWHDLVDVKRRIKCTCVHLRNKIIIINARDESVELPQHVIAQVNVYRCFDKLEVFAQLNGGCECV